MTLNELARAGRRKVQRWRFLWGPSYRHSCQKCGFMAFLSNQFEDAAHSEATPDIRRIVAADGKAGWFAREDSLRCYRGLWNFDDTAAVDAITYEANRPRFHCPGFYPHSHGRTPKEHLTLEDERRGYGYQRRLAWLAFFGGIFGGLVGAATQLLF